MKLTVKLAASAAIAAMSLGSVSTGFVALSAGGAWAKSEKSGDKGKSSEAHEKSAEKKAASAASTSKGQGALRSQLKNLNAMCANSHAFDNAADGSNIGGIRAYNQAYQDLLVAQQAFDDLATSLAGGDPDLYAYYSSRLTDTEIDAEIAALGALVAADSPLIGTLDGNGDPIVATTAMTQAEIDARVGELGTYSATLATLVGEEDDEHAAMLVASHNRELSPEALDALRNPQC